MVLPHLFSEDDEGVEASGGPPVVPRKSFHSNSILGIELCREAASASWKLSGRLPLNLNDAFIVDVGVFATVVQCTGG
jgi:hypothetical protein